MQPYSLLERSRKENMKEARENIKIYMKSWWQQGEAINKYCEITYQYCHYSL